jgi:hypothetical protein
VACYGSRCLDRQETTGPGGKGEDIYEGAHRPWRDADAGGVAGGGEAGDPGNGDLGDQEEAGKGTVGALNGEVSVSVSVVAGRDVAVPDYLVARECDQQVETLETQQRRIGGCSLDQRAEVARPM